MVPRNEPPRIMVCVREYLNTPKLKFGLFSSSVSARKSVESIAKDLVAIFSKASPLEKIGLLSQLEDVVLSQKQIQSPTAFLERKKKLLLAVTNHISNESGIQADVHAWKSLLLRIDIKHCQEVFYTPVEVNYEVSSPVDLRKRFVEYPSRRSDVFTSTAGTTFFTNSPNIIKQNKEKIGPSSKISHILDSLYIGVFRHDRASCKKTISLTVGDGCGGHFGEEQQDNEISRVSHMATRYASWFMELFENESELEKAMPALVDGLAHYIRMKYRRNKDNEPKYQEGTTLTGGRTFLYEDKVTFVGFGIGDSTIVCYDLNSKRCETLIPSRQTKVQQGNYATAVFPLQYAADEVITVRRTLSRDVIIIPMSDGALDCFPTRRNEVMIEDRTYQDTVVDSTFIEKLFEDLLPSTAPSVYIDRLTKHIVTHAENSRSSFLSSITETDRYRYHQLDEKFKQMKVRPSQDLIDEYEKLSQAVHIISGDDVIMGAVRPASAQNHHKLN